MVHVFRVGYKIWGDGFYFYSILDLVHADCLVTCLVYVILTNVSRS